MTTTIDIQNTLRDRIVAMLKTKLGAGKPFDYTTGDAGHRIQQVLAVDPGDGDELGYERFIVVEFPGTSRGEDSVPGMEAEDHSIIFAVVISNLDPDTADRICRYFLDQLRALVVNSFNCWKDDDTFTDIGVLETRLGPRSVEPLTGESNQIVMVGTLQAEILTTYDY